MQLIVNFLLFFSTALYFSSEGVDRLPYFVLFLIRRVSEVVEMPLMVDQYVSGVSTHDDA